ncbi:MAG TPA: DUF6011 domain-containing protein [Candidatus Hodarchaeales archaeon]|nr:DUF6011 domain-containing protein [Candidatus Hodarchaeales archaeon]
MSEQEVVAEAAPKKVAKPKYEGPACSVCGKPLTDPESVKLGIGPLCRAMGWTKETIAAKMTQLKRDTVPEGWVKLADVDKRCRLEGIPVARLVRAIGGDRGMKEPINENFAVIYVGRARYMSPYVLTPEGLNLLSDRYLGQPKPEPKVRVKKEKAEGEAAPKTKKAKASTKEEINVSEVWGSN